VTRTFTQGDTPSGEDRRGKLGATLEASDLRLSYPLPGGGRLEVLDIERLTIAAGARVAVQGPSGSGKTSLVHALAGIERPRSGSIVWDGVDIVALGETARDRWRRRELGLVFQQFHLFPGLSALENVLLPSRFGSFTAPMALVRRGRALLDRVGVRSGGDIARLSRGEMQRVAVARALLMTPRLIIADEPTASLDAVSAAQVMDLLFESCAANGASFIAITHDAALARRFPAIYALSQGRLHPIGQAGAGSREAAAE
jgi:putative ABC transport system ATP-binding protein